MPSIRHQTVRIRPAVEADLADVQACLRTTWHHTYDPIFGADEVTAISARWHALDLLRSQLDERNGVFLVACDDARVLGTASARLIGPNEVRLGRLYVLPAVHGQGFGRDLLAAAVAAFPHLRRMELEVEPRNTQAVRFYTRQGFKFVRASAECGGDPSVTSVIYEKIFAAL